MSEPSLSVVIAAWPNLAGLPDCLEALGRQGDSSTEFIVVSTLRPGRQMVARFPWVRWSPPAPDRLIPHLWGLGMARSRGKVIAITTAHFIPASDWIPSIRSAHIRWQSWAVGGKIEPPPSRDAVSWAIYFLRYSSYLGYQHEQTVPDVAGDNASYKRAALMALPHLRHDGFWEQEVHRQLRAEGRGPVFVPAIRVTQVRSFGFGTFLRQRFRHGKHFGRARAQRWAAGLRLVAAAASPLIPVVFLLKIVVRVLRSRQHLGRFLFALPALLAFLLAWSAGEACGYLWTARRGNTGRPLSPNDFLPILGATSHEVPPCP